MQNCNSPQGRSIFGDRVFIIAEAGVNHNGSIETAFKMVDAAQQAGVDAIKFQTFKSEKLVTRAAEKAEYQKENTGKEGSQLEMLKKLELSHADHRKLLQYCQSKGIMFLSTPFDFDSIDLLEDLGISMYKISSGDLINMPFLKYIAEKKKPMIVSTGMASLGEVEEALCWIRESADIDICLLHCTTDYPTQYEDVNLRAMDAMRTAFRLPVGYSDHTRGIEVPIAAVAMGACVIEKHFTLDKQMEGPDHKASLDPVELEQMVSAIRNIEKAVGSGVKQITKREAAIKSNVRKSIVAKTDIKKGSLIEADNITVKRPEGGIEPKYFYKLAGSTAVRDIQADELIKWEDIKL